MANNFFTASGNPATNSQGLSATMRAEFESIEDGFDKLPTMTGNGLKVVGINAAGTSLEAVAVTGTGSVVKATGPTLVTPDIGVATATSVNGTTIPSSKTLVVTTDKISALAATTSLELAGVISDETGSGALVFGTSPTLSSPAITGGTIDNTPIGATTANTGKFTSVTSSGTIEATSGGFKFPDGTIQTTAATAAIGAILYAYNNLGGF